MAGELRSLTVYRIHSELNGKPVKRFVDVVENPKELASYDLKGIYDFKAKLFVAKAESSRPDWSDFLKHGFGPISEVSETTTNSAVLVLKVSYRSKNLFFALTFGSGRYLLKSDSFVRKYGLRVVLNTIFPSSGARTIDDTSRVRSIDARTVNSNTVHTRRQTDFGATFESFEVDIQRDLLRAITGQPFETGEWGSRISGANALYLRRNVRFEKLGELCRQVERVARRNDYKERFSWIDNIMSVTDTRKIDQLEKLLLEKLITEDTDNLELAPPELLDWDRIDGFTFSNDPTQVYPELRLGDYLDVLKRKGKLDKLTLRQLRAGHKIDALDADSQSVHRWSVGRCLTGELQFKGKTYLVNGSDFFEVATGFISRLNADVAAFRESSKKLPDAPSGIKEGPYNELAANSSRNYLLLDRKLVTIKSKTTPIEICDILTRDRCFIHVKRGHDSSDLSHLFSQAYVSGDLFLMSSEFREAAQKVIQKAEEKRSLSTGSAGFRGRFSAFNTDSISPADYEIIYAIMDSWGGRNLVNVLPFFSKVNLRRNIEDLRRMGYKVSYKRIRNS